MQRDKLGDKATKMGDKPEILRPESVDKDSSGKHNTRLCSCLQESKQANFCNSFSESAKHVVVTSPRKQLPMPGIAKISLCSASPQQSNDAQ